MNHAFPQEAIDFLRACRHDPGAVACYEFRSGNLNWVDEHYLAFKALCRSLGCTEYFALFAYRTSLILGRPREGLRSAWDEVRERCPEWIGFRPERVSPNAELQGYLYRTQDEF
ncbi:MAG: hypothetical protein JWO38_5174 [Gemmataceae bacterium]|nr:hypothetical protein [Gemmataceae bacterium]